MTTIYLIRHAEAEGNLYRRLHGHYNSLITDNGYRQIKALEERFRDIPVDAVYSSDLFRTMTTARAIYVPKGLELNTRPDLREINMGDWEDRTFASIAVTDYDMMMEFTKSSAAYRAPNGESFGDIRQRGSAALLDIAAKHPGQTVAVFAHGTLIRNTLAAFQNIPQEEVHKMGHSDNTAVAKLEVEEGQVTVVYADDNSHLSQEISTLAQQHWWKKDDKRIDVNLWYRPADLDEGKDERFYMVCREDAWKNLYGELDEKYEKAAFLADAWAAWRKDPRSLIYAMKGDKPIGILQLDLDRDAGEGRGYIAFLYLAPKYRNNGIGVQLIGKAVSVVRPLGRHTLRLCCSEQNTVAVKFYQKYGFRITGSVPGAYGPLHEMEKPIGYDNQGEYLL